MSVNHSPKQVARLIRDRRQALAVRRTLYARGYGKARMIDNADLLGARVVLHDLVLLDVHIMVRATSHTLTPGELHALDCGYVLQRGSHDVTALCAVLASARAAVNVDKVTHWAT
jgi:hypothetical protein